jgi:Ran GTPase-activating protein (RanGAP) involved in mRNA processing and transport
MWEEIGPVNIRAIMDTFSEIAYKHLKTIRLWKVKAEDEGVRSICNYIEKAQTIEYLDLLDNDISPLGCEFLGKVLGPNSPIVKLKLDHNCFGTEGLRNLTGGLSKNSTIEKLSLKYCKIDQFGSKYLQDILANINSKLKSIKLQGNPLKNEGVFQLLRAAEFN